MSDNNICNGDCNSCASECIGEGGATVTLNLDDGSTVECAILTIYEAAGKDYIALLPLNENGDNETGEVYLYRYTEEDGQPSTPVPTREPHYSTDIGQMVEPAREDSIQMKIVLDTNCLVNVIMPGSYNNDIWQAFRLGKFVLCVTNEILFEYHEILAKRREDILL